MDERVGSCVLESGWEGWSRSRGVEAFLASRDPREGIKRGRVET